MTTHTNRHLLLACGTLLVAALSLVATDAAIAGYGYGGGGGNKPKPKPRPPKANVVAKVKKGNLVLKGSTGSLFVRITPTPTGLRVESRNGETKINGGDEPFLAVGVIGDWKVKCGRALAIELDMGDPEPGAPRPTPVNVAFTGGKRSELELRGIDIAGDLKVDMRRSLNRRVGSVTLDDALVGGDVTMRGSSDDTTLTATDCVFSGMVKMNVRVRSRSSKNAAGLDMTSCDVGSLAVVIGRGNGRVRLDDVKVDGDARARGDVDLSVTSSSVGGDLALTASFDEQSVVLSGSTITGSAVLSTGSRNDAIVVSGCSIGLLDVRAGSGNDRLETDGSTWGAGSAYDGSKGREDRWTTDGALDALSTTGVEEIGSFE